MNNINSKQKEEKVKNVYHKLSKSTDKMLGISGMNGYSSTEEFLKAFKNHLSIAKICRPENIQDCWGSKQVTLTDGKKFDISKVTTVKGLRIPSNDTNKGFKDIMGFVMNDGTPFIVSYNTECDMSLSDGKVWLADKSSSTGCLAGIFDYNGGKKPNKLTSDVINFNASSGLGATCGIEVGNSCYTSGQLVATPMTKAQCEAEKGDLGIKNCSYDNDYWAAAAKICGGVKNMMTEDDLKKIADEMYPALNVQATGRTTCSGNSVCKNNDVAIKYGLGTSNSNVQVWTGTEVDSAHATHRAFYPTFTISSISYVDGLGLDLRYTSTNLVVCKAD